MRKFLFLFMSGVLFFGMLASPARSQFFFTENSLVGEKAPMFRLPDLSGASQDFAKLSEGKNAILFFWATWCPHCREQLRELKRKANQIKSDGVVLILVDLGEDPRSVAGYLKKNNIDLPVLLDVEGRVSEDYKVLGIPTFILIDKKGVVRKVDHFLPDDYASVFRPRAKR